jgi:hypothetical protein
MSSKKTKGTKKPTQSVISLKMVGGWLLTFFGGLAAGLGVFASIPELSYYYVKNMQSNGLFLALAGIMLGVIGAIRLYVTYLPKESS